MGALSLASLCPGRAAVRPASSFPPPRDALLSSRSNRADSHFWPHATGMQVRVGSPLHSPWSLLGTSGLSVAQSVEPPRRRLGSAASLAPCRRRPRPQKLQPVAPSSSSSSLLLSPPPLA